MNDSRFIIHKCLKLILPILLVGLVVCCVPFERDAEKVAEQSGNPEIRSYLQHYKKLHDRKKYAAACFLVANMRSNYTMDYLTGGKICDIDVVICDSLIYSTEKSFEIWKTSPFLSEYSFNDFCEYILPYRVANEPITYYWKESLNKCLNVENCESIEEAAHKINSSIVFRVLPTDEKTKNESYTEMVGLGYGKCEDRAALLTMTLRSNGIPAAYEFVPYWGSNNNGHAFVSVIRPDGSVIPLVNSDNVSRSTSYLSRKTPKIYRKTFSMNKEWSIIQEKNREIPTLFQDKNVKDVTAEHRIPFREVHLDGFRGCKTMYLSVFSPDGWIPIAYGSGGNFEKIGTGGSSPVTKVEDVEDLGEGILYLPYFADNGCLKPSSCPIVVSDSLVERIVPDTLSVESVTLYRKYPLSGRVRDFAKSMVGGVFECSDNPNFANPDVLCKITEAPECRMQTFSCQRKKGCRYVRYRKVRGVFSIAELKILNIDGSERNFKPIACPAIEGSDFAKSKVYDSDPLTYLEISGGLDFWIGADMGGIVDSFQVGFAPRNDDNAISPGDTYELLYWNGKWNSLGTKQACDYSISFDGVPRNAVLWLRDLTRGREERPFMYREGKQIWW